MYGECIFTWRLRNSTASKAVTWTTSGSSCREKSRHTMVKIQMKNWYNSPSRSSLCWCSFWAVDIQVNCWGILLKKLKKTLQRIHQTQRTWKRANQQHIWNLPKYSAVAMHLFSLTLTWESPVNANKRKEQQRSRHSQLWRQDLPRQQNVRHGIDTFSTIHPKDEERRRVWGELHTHTLHGVALQALLLILYR